MSESLHQLFVKFISEYSDIYEEVTRTKKFDNPFGDLIRRSIPQAIEEGSHIDKNIYQIKGKCGAGRWSAVPYIMICDRRITTSAQKGVYIVYLLNKDTKTLYLVFEVAATEQIHKKGQTEDTRFVSVAKNNSAAEGDLKLLCENIRAQIRASNLSHDELINTGNKMYDAGSIYYKQYTLDSLPSDTQLFDDLMDFLALYEQYYDKNHGSGDSDMNDHKVFNYWPSGARDTTEFPKINLNFDVSLRDHLEGFLQLDGQGWTDYDGQNEASQLNKTGQRLRTYRKMYEKLGVLYKDSDDKIRLSRLGLQMKNLETDLDNQKNLILDNVRSTAVDILSRYQLRNPVEDYALPEDCDVMPSIVIWKAMRELDNKLNFEEMNRVILRIMRMTDLDNAIEKIKSARVICPDYSTASEDKLTELLGDPVHTDQVQARIAPWFSFIGWGGLIIEQNVSEEGFRTLVNDSIPLIDAVLTNPPRYYEAKDEEDWIDYYVGNKKNIAILNSMTFKLASLPDLFKDNLAKRFITSLLSKPFVILTGNSGAGKTRIAIQIAEYMIVEDEKKEKNWELVPVGADWTDNTKILGFYNPFGNGGKGVYQKTKILELIERANNHPESPYFLILDEMNLSHVERYFSDFLSHMETKGNPFILDGYDSENRSIYFPENLFIIGTVNIDETTYMFSPKVLDRANVIEFKPDEESVLNLFDSVPVISEVEPANDGTAQAFLNLKKEVFAGKRNIGINFNIVKKIFKQVYMVTEKCDFEFAYRTVKEVSRYISAAFEISDMDAASFNREALISAIDEQLLQKVLPKVHGNRKEIGNMLAELKALCSNIEKTLADNGIDLSEDEKEILADHNQLPLSLSKITAMEGKLANVQFASFI